MIRLSVQTRALMTFIGVVSLLVGCAPKATRITLTTFDEQGAARAHYSDFTWAFYRSAAGGIPELVLRSEQPSHVDPTQTVTQIVYVKTFWAPQPGTTYADATQINARIQYAILTPPTGVRYDGAAFVIYEIDRRTGELVGYIESGTLMPRYRMGDVADPFGPVRLGGEFRAVENPREVVNTAHRLETQFKEQSSSR